MKNVFVASCAIFAMFFGSGNIVLPLQLAQQLHGSWFLAFIGFCITAVAIPLLGLVCVMLLGGESDSFFSFLGKRKSFWIQFIILSINGPLGIVPRCVTVAFGGMKGMSPETSLWIFSTIFCIIITIFIFKKEQIMNVISKILTPIKFTCLIGVVAVGLVMCDGGFPTDNFPIKSLISGISYGYLTMDLCGSIYFAALIMGYLKKSQNMTKHELLKAGLMVSFVSAILLIVVYCGFFMLGVGYFEHITNLNGEDILPKIINVSLGNVSTYVVCTTIIIACLTTAVAFLSVWVLFISSHLSQISYKVAVILGILLTFFTSLFGFQHIANVMMYTLQIIYPALILIMLYHFYQFAYNSKKQENL